MFSLFKHPKKRLVYAVTKGTYLGELWVCVENTKSYKFLSLPEMHVRDIPKDKFDLGLKEGILDVVNKLPNYVYKVCYKQYLKNSASS